MKSSNKQNLKPRSCNRASKQEGLFFFGEYERSVKNGRLTLPAQFRQFKDGEAIAFRKSNDFPFLTLFSLSSEKLLSRHKPKIIKHVSIASGGQVNLGDICRKVFNRLDFDAVILGAVNGIQVWDKKAFIKMGETTVIRRG